MGKGFYPKATSSEVYSEFTSSEADRGLEGRYRRLGIGRLGTEPRAFQLYSRDMNAQYYTSTVYFTIA